MYHFLNIVVAETWRQTKHC